MYATNLHSKIIRGIAETRLFLLCSRSRHVFDILVSTSLAASVSENNVCSRNVKWLDKYPRKKWTQMLKFTNPQENSLSASFYLPSIHWMAMLWTRRLLCLPNEICGSQRCETDFMCVYRVKWRIGLALVKWHKLLNEHRYFISKKIGFSSFLHWL